MKKSLLLVALLGTFGVATAQTNVTLYGTVDAGVAYTNGATTAGKTLSVESGQQSYSRLGFKGTEDLGGGMKALFVLEQGILIDEGDAGLATLGSGISSADVTNRGTFSSQAYVGVSSNFGTVKVGRQFSPLYAAYASIDPFMNGFASNINSFFGTDSFNQSNYQRMSNAVIYNTADNAGLLGFKGSLAYGFGEVAGATSDRSQFGLSLGYANGPLTVSYAYHHSKAEAVFGPSTATDAFKTNFIGAAYDLGVVKVHGAFDQNQQGNFFKTQDYMLGVTAPYGNHSLFANYTHKKNKVTNDANANQFGIGYTYGLSKRTNLYTSFNHLKNNRGSQIHTSTLGNSVNTFQIGMRHSF